MLPCVIAAFTHVVLSVNLCNIAILLLFFDNGPQRIIVTIAEEGKDGISVSLPSATCTA